MLTSDLIKNLYHVIRQSIDVETQKPKEIKNYTQMMVLFYLLNNENKTVYQKDIGNALKLKKSSITENLDYLETIGMIERVQDQNDKRKNSIKLSKKANEKKIEVDAAINKINEKAIRNIPKDEIEIFEKVVKKMEENLK